MKILYIIDSLTAGGKERRLVELIKGLKDYSDIQCELATMSKDIHYQYVFKQDIRIHYLIRKWKKDPRILLKLYKLCKEFKPDIIHSWGSMPSVYAFPIAKILKIKFINAMISDAPLKLKVFSKAWIRSKVTFPFSDVILSNSNAGLKSYNVSMYKGYCIHNGFDFSRIENIENKVGIKLKFGIKTEKVVGMIGAFADRKDYKTYLFAAMKILSKRNDVSFMAVGDGENLEDCKNMVKKEYKDKIIFTEKQNDVESIINVFDIGILITNLEVHGEGISNSIMEYMSLDKPVIATCCGGTPEIVEHDKTGFLITPKSVEELASKIEYLLENENIAYKMGIEARKRIKQEFSLNKMVNSFLTLYKSVINH